MIYKLKDQDTNDSIEFEGTESGSVIITIEEFESIKYSLEITKEQVFTLVGALHTIQKHSKNK